MLSVSRANNLNYIDPNSNTNNKDRYRDSDPHMYWESVPAGQGPEYMFSSNVDNYCSYRSPVEDEPKPEKHVSSCMY
jgi:hypothetical protein